MSWKRVYRIPEAAGAVRRPATGELRLMLAMLLDVIALVRDPWLPRSPHGRRLLVDAELWIADRDRTWLFSFENVCDALDVDPVHVRDGLRLLRRRTETAHGDASPRDAAHVGVA